MDMWMLQRDSSTKGMMEMNFELLKCLLFPLKQSLYSCHHAVDWFAGPSEGTNFFTEILCGK